MGLGKWVADLGKWVAGYELSMRIVVAHCRDWFRMSHKEYRSFTKMSAKRQQNRSTPRIQAAFGSNNPIILNRYSQLWTSSKFLL